ncbi:MAG: hypothetical protein HOH20_12190 [Rhodospirillaceae bacterium]|nr:hypothetical protein [Rhodospirillaceae bacterium]MBT6090330.1 hypothetical protein [Rhodospirillaceae bacterium]
MAETTQEAGETADPRLAKLVYMLLLFGLIVSPLAVIGLIIAYVQNDTGPAWLNSHYRFQIRTFWLGFMFVVFLISMSGVLAEITILATFFSLVLGLCLLVWWLARCIKGYKRASRRLRLDRPEALGFGS